MPGTKVNEVKKEVSPIRKEYNRMKCKESLAPSKPNEPLMWEVLEFSC